MKTPGGIVHALEVVLGLLYVPACGADYYDKAPSMALPTAPAKASEGPKRPTFVLGKGVPEDVEDAAWALYLRCDSREAKACTELGKLYASSQWNVRDEKRAAELYAKGCGAGDAAGCENLAEAYSRGRGVARDPEKGSALYEQACKGHRAFSCGVLGAYHAAGHGVARDVKRAHDYLQRACEGGDGSSCDLRSEVEACDAGDKQGCKRLDELKRRYDAEAAPAR